MSDPVKAKLIADLRNAARLMECGQHMAPYQLLLQAADALAGSEPESMRPTENLVERCKEVLAWKSSGVLKGEALRTLAEVMPDESYALRLAETMTADQAMQFVIDSAGATNDGVKNG